jgi:arylsulfatase A-like enzyme
MTRRSLLRATASLATSPLIQAAPRKTNILLILADDLGYECLSCYGSTSYKTPNLDRLAQTGIRFTHAYAQPLCTPTRIQLMTGKYLYRNWKAFGVMDPAEKTFGHFFRDAGYRTAIAGKWQFWSYNPPDFEPEWRGKGMLVKDAGFDQYLLWHTGHTEDKGSRYGDPTYEENGRLFKDQKGKYGPDLYASFLKKFMTDNRDRPFFAYYPMTLTHGPFTATPKSKLWNAARLKSSPKDNFKDMVEYMDEKVGDVVSHLDSLGIRDNTLVLFFADNGTDRSIQSRLGDQIIKGGKGLTTDAGTRVPMIANWKGVTPQGRVVDDLIDSTDFIPTMFDACGAARPKTVLDGVSFLPQLEGKKGKPRQWQFCHFDPLPGHGKEDYKLVRYARTNRYKLYEDGRLYDVPRDVLEMKPIPGGQEDAEGRQARNLLTGVLASHHP